MIKLYFSWEIPEALHSEFIGDWTRVTANNRSRFGLISATLRNNNTTFLSEAVWPDMEHHTKWLVEAGSDSERLKWRAYKSNQEYSFDDFKTIVTIKDELHKDIPFA